MSDIVTEFNMRQHIFVKYTLFVLVDLTVLNFFAEYCENVYVSGFTVSLLAAILLQVLLQATLYVEHKVAHYFKTKEGLKAKILRGIATWGILFVSKLIILKAIAIAFGEKILFHGPIHGLVTFIVVVIAIIIAEQLIIKITKILDNK